MLPVNFIVSDIVPNIGPDIVSDIVPEMIPEIGSGLEKHVIARQQNFYHNQDHDIPLNPQARIVLQ